MMNNLLSCLFILAFYLILPVNGQAQIQIDQNDLPSVGDTVRRSVGLITPGLDYTTTGANTTWDYITLQWISQGVDSFASVSSTGVVYSVVFVNIGLNPNRANLAEINLLAPPVPVITISDAIGFYYKTSSVFEQAGYGAGLNGIPTAVPFDNRDRIYNLPVTFGDMDSSESSYSVSLPGVGFFSHEQKRVNTVDGWGSITTPYGTFDALRVKSRITSRDSVYDNATGIGFGFDNPPATEYKWLGKSIDLPILQINTSTNFGFEIVNRVIYIDSLRNTTTGLPAVADAGSVELFPNPANQQLQLSIIAATDAPGVRLRVFSITGAEVVMPLILDLKKGMNYISLDEQVLNLQSGFYSLLVETNNGIIRKKFVVSR
jgi:hypothetical protein